MALPESGNPVRPESNRPLRMGLMFALVFLLLGGLGYLSLAFPAAYGPFALTPWGIEQTSVWLVWGMDGLLILFAYLLGTRIDFRRQILYFVLVIVAADLLARAPELVVAQTTATRNVFEYSFSLDPLTAADYLAGVFQTATIPIAGLALAFFRGQYVPREGRSVAELEGSLRPRWFFIVAFVVLALSYPVSDLFSNFWPQSGDQSAFFRLIFAGYSPYQTYVFYLFYPVLFFLAFYFMGKRLDVKYDLRSFGVYTFVGAVVGIIVGETLGITVSNSISAAGTFLSNLLSLDSLEGKLVGGLFVLALAFAAASLGFVRQTGHPPAITEATTAGGSTSEPGAGTPSDLAEEAPSQEAQRS